MNREKTISRRTSVASDGDASVTRGEMKGMKGEKHLFSRRLSLVFGAIFFVTAAALLLPATAYAYLDPGSGSYLFMMLAAGILALGFWIKSFFRVIKNFFSGLFHRKPPQKESPKKSAG